MLLGLHERSGIIVRSLGDHLHFQVPLWRDLLTRFGTVDGTRENCEALMRAGEPILVFPGGAREVFKHKGEQYHLIWKNRTGFAALAIAHGYPIVPFAAVGAEDCYDILVDSDDPAERARTPPGVAYPRADELPPVVNGSASCRVRSGSTFASRARSRPRAGPAAAPTRTPVSRCAPRLPRAIEHGIAALQHTQSRDPEGALTVRLMRRLAGKMPGSRRRAALGRPKRQGPAKPDGGVGGLRRAAGPRRKRRRETQVNEKQAAEIETLMKQHDVRTGSGATSSVPRTRSRWSSVGYVVR